MTSFCWEMVGEMIEMVKSDHFFKIHPEQDLWQLIAYFQRTGFILGGICVWLSCPNDFFRNTSKTCHLVGVITPTPLITGSGAHLGLGDWM